MGQKGGRERPGRVVARFGSFLYRLHGGRNSHNWYIHKREDIKELAQGRDGQEGRGNDVLAKVCS
jgi:hypothetical protein